MRTILVTGGAGFIGANFVRQCVAGGLTVINLDALTYAGHLASLRDVEGPGRHVFVHGSICDVPLVESLLGAHRPEAVVHFAAESHVDRSIEGPAAFMETNVHGTFLLLEATRRYWETLTPENRRAFRFLHVSTDEVYGSLGEAGYFTEDSPYRPNSPYAASKAASDHLVRAYGQTYGLPAVTTHCSNNYGPYQFPEKLIPHMISRARRGLPLPVYGDGRHVRDWLFVGDHCAALAAALDHGRPGATYNIGGNCEVANLDLVLTLCALLEELAPEAAGCAGRITFVADRPGHDRRYAIDASRIRDELGWQPQETLASGLRRTVAWYLDHAAWCAEVSGDTYHLQRRGLLEGDEV